MSWVSLIRYVFELKVRFYDAVLVLDISARIDSSVDINYNYLDQIHRVC